MAENSDFSNKIIFANVVVLLLILCESLIMDNTDDSLNLKCTATFLNVLNVSSVGDTVRKMITSPVNVHIRAKIYIKTNRFFFVIVSYYIVQFSKRFQRRI